MPWQVLGTPWWDRGRHADRRPVLLARNRIRAAIRDWFVAEGFVELEEVAYVELEELASIEGFDEDLAEETVAMIAERRVSDDAKEGLSAFLEKRKPNWAV